MELPRLKDKPLPEFSLGWEVLDWCSAYLAQPDGENMGDTWRFSAEQARFLVHFYAVDEYGKFLYDQAVLERVKGWGKSPMVAAMCCAELLGPVKFDGWNADGMPVGKPAATPLVQIAAISDSQADNTMTLVAEMLKQGEAGNTWPLEVFNTKVVVPGHNRKLEKVTASPRGREGNRATFIVADETGLWVPAEHGPKLAEALRRNLTKMSGRMVETTNAPLPGENSVAEETHNFWESILKDGQNPEHTGLLFDTISVSVEDIYDKEQAMPGLIEAYGDSTWVDLERVWRDINNPSNRESSCRRFFFNQMTTGESGWLKEKEWDACENPKLKPLKKTDKIALGFKSGTRNGAGALVACRLTDMSLWMLGFWEKPQGAELKWEVPSNKVDTRVRKILDQRDVYWLCAEPTGWADVIGRWAADYEDIPIQERWQTSRAIWARQVEQFESAVRDKRLQHYNQPDIGRHILNCHIQESSAGDLLRKETASSERYIQAALAAVLALEAAVCAIEDGALKKEPAGVVWTM